MPCLSLLEKPSGKSAMIPWGRGTHVGEFWERPFFCHYPRDEWGEAGRRKGRVEEGWRERGFGMALRDLNPAFLSDFAGPVDPRLCIFQIRGAF